MKLNNIAGIASLLLATLTGAHAATTLTAWTFDNVATGTSASPATSTGFGSAAGLGFGGSSSPTVVSQAGSSAGGAHAWSVGNTGGSSVGWATNAAIGAQGAQFAASTLGYYQVKVSFDVYAKTNSEAALLVQYSQDGLLWQNANITAAGSAGILATNTIANNGIVANTSYLILTNHTAAGWNNGVTVDLTGVPGVANDPAFTIRIVNATTGTNCFDVTGATYANNGDWTLDNVTFTGVSFDTVADWTFDNIAVAKHINNPVPAISNNLAVAKCIGFGTPASPLISSTFTPNNSTNDADVLVNGIPYSSTGSAGQNVWRLRGQPGNGWLTTQPIGSQGAEFDVDTTHYTNILVTFDAYFTTQGEARMCVLYTTDGWVTTNVANGLACSSYPEFIQTNTPSGASESQGYTSDIVNGTYFDQTIGSLFFNYWSIDFTGIPGVANNPLFGFRFVNAAQNGQCVNYLHQGYNNNSGNTRIDNVAVNGQFNGLVAPVLTNALVATVDAPFTNTFTESVALNDVGWHTNISSVYVNGVKLTNTAYTVTASNIVFIESASLALQVAGLDYIVINATNYTSAKVVQFVATGVATKLTYTQLAGPSASGGTLLANPVFTATDQYNNGTTNPYVNMLVTATVSNSPATWTLGGSTVQTIVNGSCTFTDLTATVNGTTAVSNAAIHFAISGGPISVTNSTSFVIGAPPGQFTQGNLAAIQLDTTKANSTFSVIELKPSAAGQTTPVNINPITATGTNALRMGGGGAGHMALSDDGTFLVFGAFDDGSSATADETFNLNRAVGTLNYTNLFTKTGQYVSTSLGGSAVRAACSPDNVDFLIDDKGGLYVFNSGSGQSFNVYEQNNYCVRSFGGSAWSLTQKVVASLPSPAVFQFNNGNVGGLDYYNSGYDGPWNTTSATPPTDGFVVDFYMLSTNGTSDPASFAILYTVDSGVSFAVGTNTVTGGVVHKFSRNADDSWNAIGAWTNTDNCNTLFATTNGNGGVYLYYANGTKDGNSIVRLTDASVTGSLNLISTNTIYTAPTGNTVIGLTFVPQQNAYATELTPPPILTAQASVTLGSSTITVTNTPDDPLWRASITGITVNGSVLTNTAYATNSSGKLVFDPTKSALLQSAGLKTIVISATGYSTNSVGQVILGNGTQLVMATEPSTTNTAGANLSTQPVLYIEDANGYVVSTNNSTVVTATVGTGTGPMTGTLTATAVSGVVTFSGLKAPTLVQTGLLLTFTNSTLSSAVDTTSITVTPSSPNKLVMKTEPSATVAAGATFSTPPAVYIEDTYGNVVTTANSNVVASVGTGTGPLTGTRTNAAVNGVATFSALAAPTLAQTGLKLTFTNAALTSAVDATSITVTAGSANKLVITTQPTAPAGNGGALATQPVVVVQDQYGNVVTTATSNIVAQVGAGAWTIGGTTTKAAVSGTATFTGLTATSAAAVSGVTISFTSAGLTGATSSPGFNIPAPIQSKLAGVTLSGGKLIFSFTNVTGLSFSVLATNNLTAPKTNWPVVGTAVESPAGSGNYQYTNSATTNGQQYFLIRQP